VDAENLALIQGAWASCSTRAIDDSVKDIDFIIEDHAFGDNGPYPYCSTFDGDLSSEKLDWWAVTFPRPVRFNCVEFTHGRQAQDGGYWVELDVQVQREPGGPWASLPGFRIFPDYDLRDRRGNRRPFESYAILFDEVEALAVRLHGRPGGTARLTTISHMGVYHVDMDSWDPASVPPPPVPRLFQLLEPQQLARMVFDIEKVTGVMMTAETPIPPGFGLDSYLDEELYQRFFALDPRQTTQVDEFERLLYETEGGDRFMESLNAGMIYATDNKERVLHVHHGGLCQLLVPVVVLGEVIGFLRSCTHFFCDGPDMVWHYRHARELDIEEGVYFRSLSRLPVLPRDRLEAMLHMLAMVANTIAGLADTGIRQERQVREMQRTIDELSEHGRRIVDQAIVYMQEHLDHSLLLAELARAVAVSPRHLTRLFKRMTGQTPIDFLIDLRLERARELLKVPGNRVTDVCNEVGYSSLSYFVRLFKRRFGVTPGKYARSSPDSSPPRIA
jgi:AraC-like DNA-binding protein